VQYIVEHGPFIAPRYLELRAKVKPGIDYSYGDVGLVLNRWSYLELMQGYGLE